MADTEKISDDFIEDERRFMSHLVLSVEQRVQALLDARRDGIVLNKFITFIVKKYCERDNNVLELLYTYIKDKDSKKKNNKNRFKEVKKYHSVINEYQKIYYPSEDDIETDIETTIYDNVGKNK